MKLGGSDDDLSAGVTVSLRRISLDNPASSTSTRTGSVRGRERSSPAGFSTPSPSIPPMRRSN